MTFIVTFKSKRRSNPYNIGRLSHTDGETGTATGTGRTDKGLMKRERPCLVDIRHQDRESNKKEGEAIIKHGEKIKKTKEVCGRCVLGTVGEENRGRRGSLLF